ncbi:MAG: ParB/RepB/Spo0J family partition protein [Acidobacteriota bacterium]
MKRRALGKGLGSLLPAVPPAMEVDGFTQLPVDQVAPNPLQPRQDFGEADLEQLADSIRSTGVLQPILVRTAGRGFELIAGERRWRAARMAGLSRIPARIHRVEEGESLQLALIENIQRRQLNPLEEARAFSDLMHRHGLTQEEVARKVGRSRSSIANSVRLLKLPERVRSLILQRKITAGHAKALLSLSSEKEILETAERFATGPISVRKAESLARGGDQGPGPRAHREEVDDPNVKDAERRLQRALGTKVRIKGFPSGRGRIEIEFYSRDELQRLFEFLEGEQPNQLLV